MHMTTKMHVCRYGDLLDCAINDELLFEYGQIISYMAQLAKMTKDKSLRAKILKDMRGHVDRYNNLSRRLYEGKLASV